MSWGFFADLSVTMTSDAWARIRARKPSDVTLAEGWSGLEDESLEEAFGRAETDATFEQVVAQKRRDAIARADAKGDRVEIRIAAMLDKSELALAQPLAALLECARTDGGRGTLRLVNDGTASAEDGVTISVEGGAWTSAPIDDAEASAGEIGGAIFGAIAAAVAKPKINPFTGQPVTAAAAVEDDDE